MALLEAHFGSSLGSKWDPWEAVGSGRWLQKQFDFFGRRTDGLSPLRCRTNNNSHGPCVNFLKPQKSKALIGTKRLERDPK